MIAASSQLAVLAQASQDAARPFTTGGPDLTRYVLVCVVLVALAGLLALALRKGLAATVRGRAARRSLAVVDVLPLGGRQRVMVVRCYDRTFLLGVGDKELTPIAELDPVLGAEAQSAAAPLPADREAFASALERIRRSLPAPRLGKPAAAAHVLTPAASAAPAAEAAPRAAQRAAATPASRPAAAGAASAPAPGSLATPTEERRPTRPRLEGIVG